MQNSQGRLKNFGDKNCLYSSFTSSIHPPVEKSNNYLMLESRDQRLPGLRRRLQFSASPGYEVGSEYVNMKHGQSPISFPEPAILGKEREALG
jgi:hypothetical protein